MDNEIEDIKRRIDIVEFIGSYVTLKKAGANYKGLCPFHNEKTPSMMVSAEKQIFKCFGCNEGGDVFSFLMKVEGLGFGDALKTLAEKAGVQLKQSHFDSLKTGEKPGQKSRLIDLNEFAAKVYHKVLLDHPKADKARAYLEGRGLTKETISEFNLGYAPDSWDFIIRFASKYNYTEKELLLAGLVVRKNQIDNNSSARQVYDRFRGRIMFPICNVLGSSVAFTGRDLADREGSPKYLNSSESPVYSKSNIIYGLDKAKLHIKQQDQVVIVEGNMDVIACHQYGFKNVVATSGTSLTKEMLQTLSRYTFNICFCFDSDNAGKIALKRAVQLAGELDLNPKVVVIPEGFKDPDEALKAGVENWEMAVEKSRPALEYLIDEATVDVNDIAKKKAAQKEMLPLIKQLKSPTENGHYLKYLAGRLMTTEQMLKEEMKNLKELPTPAAKAGSEEIIVEKMTDQEKLLAIMAEKIELFKDSLSEVIDLLKPVGDYEQLIIKLKSIEKVDLAAVKEIFEKTTKKNHLKESWLRLSADFDEPEEELPGVALDLIKALKKLLHEDRKNTILQQISEAEQKGDKTEKLRLLKELSSAIINNK